MALIGCGGGGDSGIVLTPQQQEFADVVYAFASAVNNKNKEGAKGLVMSDLVYNKSYGFDEFRDRLENFIDNAEDINFQINDIGVSFLDTNQDSAEIRANATISYNDVVFNEILEIYVEKSGSKKGISLFQKYRSEVSAFPPVLE